MIRNAVDIECVTEVHACPNQLEILFGSNLGLFAPPLDHAPSARFNLRVA